jgi:ABC-2 type transport system permease protein
VTTSPLPWSAWLREAQADGSLEVLLATPLSTLHVIVGMAAYPILSALVRAIALLAAGGWLFGAELHVDPRSFLAALALSVAAFAPLGLLSAAFVLVFKRGDPFSYALDAASYLLCGVIYPLEVLPPTLRLAAQFLPATHALEAMRGAVLHRTPVTGLFRPLGALALFAVVAWPLAALVLSGARRHAEKAGTLGHS